jgi:predicted membrane chloride channel (bestrophin family)
LAKAFIPGGLSVALYFILFYLDNTSEDEGYLNHPYAVGVLVSSVSFLIIFRANYGYQRYWEACTCVHHLMSKWMDCAMFIGVFHLQSDHFKDMNPPNFFDYRDLNDLNLTRDRESTPPPLDEEFFNDIGSPTAASERSVEIGLSHSDVSSQLRRRRFEKSIHSTKNTVNDASRDTIDRSHDQTRLFGPGRLDGGWGMIYPNDINGKPTATYYDIQKFGKDASRIPPSEPADKKGFASTKGGRTPSLFLQELTHLASLLCAVALTTLRNDLDDVESPLGVYTPGQKWPEVDPHYLSKDVRRQAYEQGPIMRNIRYLLGIDQTKHSRTIYNAARPMLVIGGVSDNEIAFLQRARGPYAKTQLVWNWFSDLLIREHHSGTLGNVGPPIISRVVQFLSDGMLYYNHARKIMFTPFPFPHAQLSAFFVLMMVVAIPLLMVQYANEHWLGALLTFLTVTCLAGLHEVARELENPFRNAPNDVPLCTLLAFYNEALITMFSGHHPDAYWNESEIVKKRNLKKEMNGVKKEGHQVTGLDVPSLSTESVSSDEEDVAVDNSFDALIDALPQCVDSLEELKKLIKTQEAKIKELQDRLQKK